MGEHHVTFHNQGLCYYSQGQLETALEQFQKSISLNPDYEKARSWIDKVTKEIAARNGGTPPSASDLPEAPPSSTVPSPTVPLAIVPQTIGETMPLPPPGDNTSAATRN